MFGSTLMQTLAKEVRSPHFAPFAIGFGSVMALSLYACRITDPKAYLGSSNPRFAKPFLKRAGLADEAAH